MVRVSCIQCSKHWACVNCPVALLLAAMAPTQSVTCLLTLLLNQMLKLLATLLAALLLLLLLLMLLATLLPALFSTASCRWRPDPVPDRPLCAFTVQDKGSTVAH